MTLKHEQNINFIYERRAEMTIYTIEVIDEQYDDKFKECVCATLEIAKRELQKLVDRKFGYDNMEEAPEEDIEESDSFDMFTKNYFVWDNGFDIKDCVYGRIVEDDVITE